MLARAAEEDAAWVGFQRMAAWWLGEKANIAADEYAGIAAGTPDYPDPTEKPPPPPLQLRPDGTPLSAGELIAVQAAENPAMLTVVAALQHAALTMPWQVRAAAAQAVAKVTPTFAKILYIRLKLHGG